MVCGNVENSNSGRNGWQERIEFRELLFSNRSIAHKYSNLKVELATRFRNERDAYTEGKSPFIRRVFVPE